MQKWKASSKFLNCATHIEEQSIWRLSKIKKRSPKCLEATGFCTNECGSFGVIDDICRKCNIGTYSNNIDIRCVQCGCTTIDKAFEQDACGSGCYPNRMDRQEWNLYKEKHNIKIN